MSKRVGTKTVLGLIISSARLEKRRGSWGKKKRNKPPAHKIETRRMGLPVSSPGYHLNRTNNGKVQRRKLVQRL